MENAQKHWTKFEELQKAYYYWCEPFGKKLGIFGTETRKRNIKKLIILLQKSKPLWLNNAEQYPAYNMLFNILGGAFVGTNEDLTKIWNYILNNNNNKGFDDFYNTLYQAKKY